MLPAATGPNSVVFASGRVVFQFFPSVEGTHLYATLTMPEGTSIDNTARAVEQLEAAAEALRLELDGDLTNPVDVNKDDDLDDTLHDYEDLGHLRLHPNPDDID